MFLSFSHTVDSVIYIQCLFCVSSSDDVVVLFVPHHSVEHELNSCADVNTYCKRSCELAPCRSLGDLFGQLMREDPSTIKGAEILMLGEMLTLPQNFG